MKKLDRMRLISEESHELRDRLIGRAADRIQKALAELVSKSDLYDALLLEGLAMELIFRDPMQMQFMFKSQLVAEVIDEQLARAEYNWARDMGKASGPNPDGFIKLVASSE